MTKGAHAKHFESTFHLQSDGWDTLLYTLEVQSGTLGQLEGQNASIYTTTFGKEKLRKK